MSADGERKVRSSALDRTVLLVAALGLFLCAAVLQAPPAAAASLGPGVVGTTVAATTTTTTCQVTPTWVRPTPQPRLTPPRPAALLKALPRAPPPRPDGRRHQLHHHPAASVHDHDQYHSASGHSPETLQRLRDLEALSGKISAKQYQIYKASIELDEVDRVLALTVEEYNLRVLQLDDAERESRDCATNWNSCVRSWQLRSRRLKSGWWARTRAIQRRSGFFLAPQI